MMLLLSEKKDQNSKFFNLSPEEKHYFNLKEKENKENISLYNKIIKDKEAYGKKFRK